MDFPKANLTSIRSIGVAKRYGTVNPAKDLLKNRPRKAQEELDFSRRELLVPNRTLKKTLQRDRGREGEPVVAEEVGHIK